MQLKHYLGAAAVALIAVALANRTNMGRSFLGGSGTTWF